MIRALRQCYIPVRASNAFPGQHLKRMYNTSAKRVSVSRTDSSGKKIKRFLFERSTSRFGRAEEEGLRIRIIDKESFSDAMGIEEAKELPPSVTDLYCDQINSYQILGFRPNDHPEMTDAACSFFVKLRAVALNNVYPTAVPRETLYINNMTTELMKAVKCDDGRELTISPCILKLFIEDNEIETSADKVGMRGTDIVWVMQEHRCIGGSGYKMGDIQLASCMIAAYQENAPSECELSSVRMMGIKIRGDRVYFYSMRMTVSYLNSLDLGAPGEDIEVFKYPTNKVLSISVPEDRRQILSHLWSMRCYAVGLRTLGRC